MNAAKPPPPKGPAPPSSPAAQDNAPGAQKKSGRVSFDKRGNAVWEWEMKTGVFGRDIDTKRMKKLEAKDLRIQEDPKPKENKTGAAKPSRAGGFDPYNSSNTGKARILDQLTSGHKPFKKKP